MFEELNMQLSAAEAARVVTTTAMRGLTDTRDNQGLLMPLGECAQ